MASRYPVSDDDVVICAAFRTPLCKARRGNLKDTLPDDMLAAVLRAVINETGVDSSLIQDICIGNVNQPGAGAQVSRIAQFFAGIPETVPMHTVNRFCSSGLQACASIAASIKAGNIDIGKYIWLAMRICYFRQNYLGFIFPWVPSYSP